MSQLAMTGMAAVAMDTKELWDATNQVIPAGLMIYETDTKGLKVTNGIDLYSDLEYTSYGNTISDEMHQLFAKINNPNGLTLLGPDALIPTEFLPKSFQNGIQFVADIPSRDALFVDDRNGLVIVEDASQEGIAGAATYDFNFDTGEWVLLNRFDRMDMSFDQFFDFTKHTLQDISETEFYLHFTLVAKEQLITMNAEVVRKQDTVDLIGPSPLVFGGIIDPDMYMVLGQLNYNELVNQDNPDTTVKFDTVITKESVIDAGGDPHTLEFSE